MSNRFYLAGYFLLSLLIVGLGGCVTTADRQKSAAENRVGYRVKSGDTLHSIAWRFGLNVNELAAWNRMKRPLKVASGQLIFLSPPIYLARQNRQPHSRVVIPRTPTRAKNSSRSRASAGTAKTSPVVVTKPPKAKVVEPENVDWQWPLVQWGSGRFVRQSVDGIGVQLKGQPGQAVFAAADGKVVYSGNNLKGYGELIIIKHSDALISAYAHNRKRFAPEGLWVKGGQKIAELGTRAGEKDAVLYFDIRRFGKSVDPLKFLPTR